MHPLGQPGAKWEAIMTVAERPRTAKHSEADEALETIEETQRLYERYLDLAQLTDLSQVVEEEEQYVATPTTAHPLAGTIETLRSR